MLSPAYGAEQPLRGDRRSYKAEIGVSWLKRATQGAMHCQVRTNTV